MISKKQPEPKTAAAATAAGSNNPLFFTKIEVINATRHATAKLRNNITMGYARTTNSIPLTMADIPEAAKYYPLAFTKSDPIIPVAIVGLEQENYLVGMDGVWKQDSYVPSYVRKYPFALMESPQQSEMALCIDEAALIFDAKIKGTALYDNGNPTQFTHNALEFCLAHQEQHRHAREFCDVLKQKDMFSLQRSDVELASGRKIQLGGFQLINADKFKSLSQAEVFEWYKRGYLAPIYYIMQSLSNWRLLLDLANEREAKTKPKTKPKPEW
jgi:hypothetical protein